MKLNLATKGNRASSLRRTVKAERLSPTAERVHRLSIGESVPPLEAAPEKGKDTIGRQNVDRWVMYIGKRVRTGSVLRKSLGTKIPELKKPGYLYIKGNKPGLLVHPVRWDGSDVYHRDELYGSLGAINKAQPALSAEVLSFDDLIERARKVNHLMEVEHVLDGRHYTVALLNNWGDDYVAGLANVDGKLRVLNMEHPARHNKKAVQYKTVRDVKDNITKFLGQIKR